MYLVSLLSLQSKAALDTKAGVNGLAASKASMNTLRSLYPQAQATLSAANLDDFDD